MDPDVWPEGVTLDTLLMRAAAGRERALAAARAYATPAEAAAVVARLTTTGGRSLRILGITCRFSAFIQHSMRDWLAGFQGMGHQTRLLIEPTDHERNDLMAVADACAAFRPDLVVAIGHHRQTIPGIPAHVPVAMWVQDVVPQVFSDHAGRAQGPLDFCLGFGRLLLSTRHGYPADQFLPATVGVNEQRFAPTPLTPTERAAFECDVSYVSHNSTPADVVFARALEAIGSPDVRRLYRDMYDRIIAHYDTGGRGRACAGRPADTARVNGRHRRPRRRPARGGRRLLLQRASRQRHLSPPVAALGGRPGASTCGSTAAGGRATRRSAVTPGALPTMARNCQPSTGQVGSTSS